MPKLRKALVSLNTTRCYQRLSRCVRRVFFVTKTPEQSDHAAIKRRIKQALKEKQANLPEQQPTALLAFAGNPERIFLTAFHLSFLNYLVKDMFSFLNNGCLCISYLSLMTIMNSPGTGFWQLFYTAFPIIIGRVYNGVIRRSFVGYL